MNRGCDEITDNEILHLTVFTSKSLLSTEWHYSNTESDAHGLLHMFENVHHYCFIREVYIITDQMPLVVILSKYMAMLCQQWQHIMLRIHQYRVHIIYKPGPDLHVTDWLSWNNHTENKDQEITGMNKIWKCYQYVSRYASIYLYS